MGRSLIEALDITVPEGVVDHIDDAGGHRIWERCELRALTGDGEVAAKAGVRRGCVTMVGGKTFKWIQRINLGFTERASSTTPPGWSMRMASYETLEANTFTYSGNVSAGAILAGNYGARPRVYAGHKYLVCSTITSNIELYRGYRARLGDTWTYVNIKVDTKTYGVIQDIATERVIAQDDIRIGHMESAQTGLVLTASRPNMLDLTATFGAGNEPANVDAAIAAYKLLGVDITQPQEYDLGSIRSAVPESVVTRGKNLCDTVLVGKAWNNANNSARAISYAKVSKGKTYTVSVLDISGIDSAPFVVLKENINDTTTIATYTNPTVSKPTTVVPVADGYLGVQCNHASITEEDVLKVGIQVEVGSTATTYEPYREPISQPIPDAVKAMPWYGWSAGSAHNHIERTADGWQYVQEVGAFDLGDYTWTRSATNVADKYRYSSGIIQPLAQPNSNTEVCEAICTKYIQNTADNVYLCKTGFSITRKTVNPAIYIYDPDLDGVSADEFRAAVTGVIVYARLATPVITDITDLMADFDWEYMVEGDRYEIVEPSGIQVPMEAAYFVRYGTAAWVSTPSLMLEMDEMDLTGGAPDNFEEV